MLGTQDIRRRAFSLIEAAIVLAIIGLVIGGIWAAMASVKQKAMLNQLYTDINTIYINLWNNYKGFDMPATPYEMGDYFYNSGLAPSSWAYNSTTASFKTAEGIIIKPVIEIANMPKFYITGTSTSICYNILQHFPFAVPNPPIMAYGDCSLITVTLRRPTN